jgi:ABC-2 type transport system ATP-binding protein
MTSRGSREARRSLGADTDAITVEGLGKRFGAITALQDVSFRVAPGELLGFIGPDGAGKTTLFRILATLLVPGSGRARVLGHDVVKDLWVIRQRVGYMPGRFSLYPDLSVEENLRFFASVFGTTLAREYEHIAPIYRPLEPFKDRRAAALSGGMKQKLALCCALVHRPEVLLLDEPTTGVDAVARREFWGLLGRLKASGLSIVVSTPYMDEANRCDRVALIQRGRLLVVDTPEVITASFDRPLFAIHANPRYPALLALRTFPHAQSVYPFGDVLHYTDARVDVSSDQIAREIRIFLESKRVADVAATPIAATVEDVFMARMTATEREDAA